MVRAVYSDSACNSLPNNLVSQASETEALLSLELPTRLNSVGLNGSKSDSPHDRTAVNWIEEAVTFVYCVPFAVCQTSRLQGREKNQ